MNQLPPDRLSDLLAGQQSDPAVRAAVEAADNSQQLQIITAFLQAQAITQSLQQPCQHQQPRQQFSATKWIVIGGVGCVCAIAFALASIAIAIGAVCATGCLIVLRSMWRQRMNDKPK